MSGFFGCISEAECTNDLFYGTDYNSHLGTSVGGMCVLNNEGFVRAIHSLKNDYFRSKFEPELNKLRGNSGIGIISDWEAQPIIVHSHLGKFALAMVGKVANLAELTERAFKKGMHFSEIAGKGINQTELVSMLIAEEDSFLSGIQNVFHHVKGSCSLLILHEKGIIAARDKLGRTPVAIGKKEGGMAVSSESISFSNLGYSLYYSLGPGEIVHCTTDSMEILRPSLDKMQICSFLWVYYGYPGSVYEGINVETCRYRCGAALAKNDTVEIDCAGGVPDSGTAHALGYSNERKVPHIRPFVKYTPTWPRSFMPQDQQARDFIARMKLIPNRDLIEGKRLVICDDSIVRGTQLKDNARKLFDEGAGEVHLRIACPVLLFPCPFLNFSVSRSSLDLAGRTAVFELEGKEDTDYNRYVDENSDHHQAMVEKIRQRMQVNSLVYQRMSDLVKAIGLPKEKLCTHCWDNSSTF